jgi:protein-S-isoprenylcysteine O-methyltransferase Ste14
VSPASFAVAWLGGVAFVASLLYFLYFYLVVLGRPVGGSAWVTPAAINAVLVAAFAVHHSIMARAGAKQALARMLPHEAERTTYVWMASALLVIVCALWRPVPGVLYDVRGAWAWLLYAVQAAGIFMALRASARLDVLELAGIRQMQGSRRSRAPVPLQVRGPYTIVRHPVYLGWVMLVFGAPHMTASRFTFALITTLYLAIAVPIEERALERAFGDSYREYKRRVRWRFLPGLY